jgi:hypothetical protein
MDRKTFFKDPNNLKMEIEKLISFEERDDLLKLKKQLEGMEAGKMTSKYSKVLSCSYAPSSIDTKIGRGAAVKNTRTSHAISDSHSSIQ